MNIKELVKNAQKTDDCAHLVENKVNLSVKRSAISNAIESAQVKTNRQVNLQKALVVTSNLDSKSIASQVADRAIKRTAGCKTDATKCNGAEDVRRIAQNISKYPEQFAKGFDIISNVTGITKDELRKAISNNKNANNVLLDTRYGNDTDSYLHVKAIVHLVAMFVNLAQPKTLKSNYAQVYAEYLSGFEPDELFTRKGWVDYHNATIKKSNGENVSNGTAIVSQFESIIRAFKLGTVSDNSKSLSLNERGVKFFNYIYKNCQFK